MRYSEVSCGFSWFAVWTAALFYVFGILNSCLQISDRQGFYFQPPKNESLEFSPVKYSPNVLPVQCTGKVRRVTKNGGVVGG